MATFPPAQSLRVLCIDGGGIKGYTSLLILKRIFRTLAVEGNLAEEPRPCQVFDLIAGTSTGGLIAVMLGRLHMTIDECIAEYEEVGKRIFGKRPPCGQLGKMVKGLASSPFYDIRGLQEEIKKVLDEMKIPRNEAFLEKATPQCKVMLCVTRKATAKADLLRNYISHHSTQENYDCQIWEAASATAAAPMYFKHVKFEGSGEIWCDGGMRRNNPINEALTEITRENDWKGRERGCVVSLGTGAPQIKEVSANLAGFLRGSVDIMTDSEDIADQFARSKDGCDLAKSRRYFRFSVPQGMKEIEMEDYKETEKMKALTTEYLSKIGSGTEVAQCAKSLLYPDENLQQGVEIKPSLLPYNPCTHFVERPYYERRLRAFFTPYMQTQQIFVLWGLGGTGKTQIALKFAHAMKYRFSVFWVRGDRFTNFAADYAHILPKLNQTTVETQNETVTYEPHYLRRTLLKLEETSGSWLMILDNTDDLDEFRGKSEQDMCVSSFIPRRGRIIITTRDRRFQGLVAGAHDGQRVDPMDDVEAKYLLWNSVPEHLGNADSGETKSAAGELLEELGNLPLAVAQAAANIVDQHLSLTEYVSLYRDKKRRMGLLQSPVQDFQSKDPRNASQSVLVTWELSFEHLQKQNPLSVTFLSYLSCFHCQGIPKRLILRLPEFRNFDPGDFSQIVKGPLHLSLVDELKEAGEGIEYSVHPLVHDRAIDRLAKEEGVRYLTPCIDLLINVGTENGTLVHDWIAHAVRQVALGEDFSIVSRSFSTLLQLVANVFRTAGLVEHGVILAARSLDMATAVWDHDDPAILRIREVKACCLNAAARYRDSEIECQLALEFLDFENIKAELTEDEIELERTTIEGYLATALGGLKRYTDVERIHRRQLQSKSIKGNPKSEAFAKHNLAHALFKQGRYEEARTINDEVLTWSESAGGREVVPRSLYLIMMNLKAHIWKRAPMQSSSHEFNHDEVLRVYLFVYHESLKLLGPTDIDTWKAANNALSKLNELQRYDEAGPILETLLTTCISANIRVEGEFAATFFITWSMSLQYWVILESNGKVDDAMKFLGFLSYVMESLDLHNFPPRVLSNTLNLLGVSLQWRGQFNEAEKYHTRASEIEMSLCGSARDADLLNVIYYNIMLALARQGRVAQAFAFREQHKTEIECVERIHGTCEERLERDRNDHEVYKQAENGLQTGNIRRGDTWWRCHQDVLNRTERRYGHLNEATTEEVSTTISPKARFWRHIFGERGSLGPFCHSDPPP